MLKTQTKEHMEVSENKDTSVKTAKEWILLQNIRSLTKNFDLFKVFISQTEVELLAICLTETSLKNSFESDCFSLQNCLKIETSNRKKLELVLAFLYTKKRQRKELHQLIQTVCKLLVWRLTFPIKHT